MSDLSRCDVAVVGAGPSGLRTARRLAENGLSVRVFERKRAVGQDVTCTGIVGLQTFRDFDLPRESVLREIEDVRLVSPSGETVSYRHDGPFAAILDRERLDRGLAAQAEAAGVAIETGVRVEGLATSGDEVRLETKDSGGTARSWAAAAAVIASGVDYTLLKRLGLSLPADFLNGAQVEVEASDALPTMIFVGRGIAPGAFGWRVPAGPGRVRVGLLTKGDARRHLRTIVERAGIAADAVPENLVRVKPVAHGLMPRTSAHRVLVVGEAAGQIKTTTGGGIGYGVRCAEIAAPVLRACFDRNDFSAAAMSAYDSAWRKALQREILIGYYTRKACARLSDARIEGLFRLAQTDGIMPLVRAKGDFDWHGDLIVALLKRLSFVRAFRELAETFRTPS